MMPLTELTDAVQRKVRRPLFATLSGAHLRGYAWPAAPYHVQGAMLLPLREVLGLRPAAESKERRIAVGSSDVLLTFQDLRRYLDQLARAANTAALEDLHSPDVLLTGPEHEQLKRIAQALLTRLAYHDFRDRAESARRRLGTSGPRVVDLLEAARLYLCGATTLLTSNVVSNVADLLEQHAVLWLRPFVFRVRQEGDGALLSTEEARLLDRELESLAARLSAAHDRSRLPDGVGSISSLDEFLVELRLRDIAQPS